MNSIGLQFDRLLALLLVSSLAACGPGERQTPQEPAADVETQQASGQITGSTEESPAEADRFANMFVSEITHDFNPGLPIGAQFPKIRALYEGEEIMTIDRFIRDRGAIFIAARSVDW
jgi:hypothetical protein